MQTLKKAERLSSKKQIELLFSEGKTIKAFPVLAFFLETSSESEYPVELLISVPKKKIRKAVKRNLIKRRIREAYRQNKADLYSVLDANGKKLLLGFVYTAPHLTSFGDIREKIITVLNRLQKEYEKSAG